VVVTVDDVNYTGSATGVLTIGKAAAVVTLGDLNQTYDGTPKLASVTTTPAGLTVVFSYDTVPSVITPPAGDLTAYAAGIGQTFYVNATGATTGNVYGSNTAGYAITSGVATAAVHAGVLTPGQTAVLQISILADAGTYTGSTQNGVTSQPASASGGSFQIVGIATSGYNARPGRSRQLRRDGHGRRRELRRHGCRHARHRASHAGHHLERPGCHHLWHPAQCDTAERDGQRRGHVCLYARGRHDPQRRTEPDADG